MIDVCSTCKGMVMCGYRFVTFAMCGGVVWCWSYYAPGQSTRALFCTSCGRLHALFHAVIVAESAFVWLRTCGVIATQYSTVKLKGWSSKVW